MPECGPCARTGSACEYYDKEKGRVFNRKYIVYLQHKVRELEDELEMAAGKDLSASKETESEDADEVLHDPSNPAGRTSLVMATREKPHLTKD